jgi:hypothetical protein
MNIQHKELAGGRWRKLTFVEQMANIGSEVQRALNWKLRNNEAYCQRAFERALELIDFSIDDSRNFSRLKELTRVREAMADYFVGTNQFSSTKASWEKYFLGFAYAARRNH